jgi:hypothetical protein
MKVTVMDFDPKKDLPNPTFKFKIGKNHEFSVYLSDIRTKFRGWILQKAYADLTVLGNNSIVNLFIKEAMFAEISKKDADKLTICLTGDIVKRMNGTVKTIQEFNSLFK